MSRILALKSSSVCTPQAGSTPFLVMWLVRASPSPYVWAPACDSMLCRRSSDSLAQVGWAACAVITVSKDTGLSSQGRWEPPKNREQKRGGRVAGLTPAFPCLQWPRRGCWCCRQNCRRSRCPTSAGTSGSNLWAVGIMSFTGDWGGARAQEWSWEPLGVGSGGSEGVCWSELGPCIQHAAVLIRPECVA